jgi:transposase-like protein
MKKLLLNFLYEKVLTTPISVSDSTISRVTDKILPVVREWQSRPLESVYAVVFMDAVHFHVRKKGR